MQHFEHVFIYYLPRLDQSQQECFMCNKGLVQTQFLQQTLPRYIVHLLCLLLGPLPVLLIVQKQGLTQVVLYYLQMDCWIILSHLGYGHTLNSGR